MKKLLSLLGVVTITGTSLTTLTSTNFVSAQIRNRNINNINNLKSNEFPENINRIENWYLFLGHNRLIARISHNTWQDITFVHDISNNTEFSNALFGILNDFEKANHSGDVSASDYISTTDLNILKNVIINHYDKINNVFLNKNNNNVGIAIRTNRDSYWSDNDKWWGAHVNNGEY